MTMLNEVRPNWASRFFTLWIGQALSLIGSRAAQFAVIWWMAETTGSVAVLATATLFAYLPDVFLGPFIGALVDRWNRRVVMIVADTTVALASAWLAYLFWVENVTVWHIYAINIISSLGRNFQAYAMIASTTLMVPERHLSRVQGANETLNGILNIGGPPLGALLLAVLPYHAIMELDVATAAFAIVPLFFIAVPQPAKNMTDTVAGSSLCVEVRRGIRYMWRWPGLRYLVMIGASTNFFFNASIAIIPLLVTEHFRGDAIQLGWLNSGFGIGIIVGGVALTIWGGFHKRILTILTGQVMAGLGFLLVGAAPSEAFWLAWGGMLISGIASGLVNGSFKALLQARVLPDLQGRVFATHSSSVQATTVLGLIAIAPVTGYMGLQAWFLAGGLYAMLLSVVAFFVPSIVNIESRCAFLNKMSG